MAIRIKKIISRETIACLASLITEDDISRYTHRLLIAVISEMLAYLLCRIYKQPSVDEFFILVEPHARRFYETFCTRSYMADDCDHFLMAEVLSVVE